MVILGDLTELNDDDPLSKNEDKDLESIPWEFHDGVKIQFETLALYSIDSDNVMIQELKTKVFEGIEKSSFSHAYPHIYQYDQLFILFFEFAIEKYTNEFEFVHFGIVPSSDFFNALNDNSIITIRSKNFHLTKHSLEKILEKVDEFKAKYPDNELL